MSKQVQVTVKSYFVEKGFGFFKRPEGKDIFVHVTLLEYYGFTPEDMIEDASAVIDVESNGDRKTTVVICHIGDKLAQVDDSRPQKRKLTIRTNQKRSGKSAVDTKKDRISDKVPAMTLDMFYEVSDSIAFCSASGVSLHEVYNESGELAQYVYCKDETPLQSTGFISEAAAKTFLKDFGHTFARAA